MINLITLPKSIIIRDNNPKYNCDFEYKLLRENCYYNKILDKILLFNRTQYETLMAIKILCEFWLDQEKLFFLVQNPLNDKKPNFIGAAEMLDLLTKLHD